MSKKGRQKNRERKRTRGNSPLTAHKQTGKTFIPPLMAISGVSFVAWERDDLPDYLLVCSFLLGREAQEVDRLHQIFDFVDEAVAGAVEDDGDVTFKFDKAAGVTESSEIQGAEVGESESGTFSDGQSADGVPPVFSGRLTEFEAFAPAQRVAVLESLTSRGAFDLLVPEELFHTLGQYPEAPGSWLLQPWRDRGLAVDPVEAERHLSHILTEAGPRQGDIATRAKALACRRWIAGERLMLPTREMAFKLLHWPYHEEEDENRAAEASYRAMFGSLVGLSLVDSDAAIQWAKNFWRSNWKLYACRWPEETPPSAPSSASKTKVARSSTETALESEPPTEKVEAEGADFWRRTVDEARADVEKILDEFQTLAETTSPDLYDPDRNEVLTGLVGRTLRYLNVFIGYPPLWTMEHGAPVLRALVETRIVLRFLVRTDDTNLYAKFKAYGMGKLKLLKLHLEKLIDEQDDPPVDLVEYVEYLDALVNQDVMEEFQEIDVGGNFAGVDTRRMAVKADLEQDYRLVFAPASSNVHGEWSIIDEYVFVRCRNPAHRRHRILRRDRDHRTGPMFLQTLFGYADLLIEDYRAATEDQRKFA